MKINPLLLTILVIGFETLLFSAFAIGQDSVNITNWSDFGRGLYALLFFLIPCIATITFFEKK